MVYSSPEQFIIDVILDTEVWFASLEFGLPVIEPTKIELWIQCIIDVKMVAHMHVLNGFGIV